MTNKKDYEDITSLEQILLNDTKTLEDIEGIRTSTLDVGDQKVTINYKLFDVDDLGNIGMSLKDRNLKNIKLTELLGKVLYAKDKERFFTQDELKRIFHERLQLASTILYFIVKESGLTDSNKELFQ